MLNLNNINSPQANNPFTPWEPTWYPYTMNQNGWQDAFIWFVQKNINDRHSNLLNKEEMRKKAILMAARELTNGNELYSKDIDTRPY